MVVAHSSPEVARPLSFKTSQFNESRQLICNFLLHFSAGRRVNERRGSRLRFVLSEALVAVMAVSYPSPGTAVAPGCRQFRGWIVCVVTVCQPGSMLAGWFGIHCETFLPLPGSMFHTLKKPAAAERSA